MKNSVIDLLRRSEKYTKTDMQYLVKGGFWSVTSQIALTGLTLLLAVSFGHFVPKEVYGEYKYILSVAAILGTFTLSGLSTAINRSVNQGYEGTLRYVFWQNLKWSVPFIFMALAGAAYYFLNDNASLATGLLIIGALTPFLNSLNLYNAYLEAKKDFRRSAIYSNVIGNLFPTICLIAAMFYFKNSLFLVAVFFVSNTIISLILYKKTLDIYRPNEKVDHGALGYSKHLSLMSILGGITGNLDQILVFHYIGPVELAIYNFAIAIPKQVKGPLKGLASMIFPKFAERGDEEIRGGMMNKIVLLFIFAVFMIIGYILAAPYIFKFFFPKYMDAVFYSQVFSLSLLWIVSIPTETYMLAKKKIKAQYISSVVNPIIQVIFLIIGIIWAGVLGLIVERVATNIAYSLISIFLFERTSREAVAAV